MEFSTRLKTHFMDERRINFILHEKYFNTLFLTPLLILLDMPSKEFTQNEYLAKTDRYVSIYFGFPILMTTELR